jgi:hypothetical protein
MKVRSDSVLAQLTQEQLATLYDWILASGSFLDAQSRALKPAPNGFGLHIHITTLRRFYQTYTAWLREQERVDAAECNSVELITEAQQELARSIHSLAHSPANVSHLKVVTAFLNSQRDVALKEGFLQLAQQQAEFTRQKLELERQRIAEQRRQWEFDAARAVMKNYVEYQKVDKRSDIDEHDKIWLAREIAFGKPPTESAPNTIPSL